MKTYIYANGEILAQHDGPVAQNNKYFYLQDRLGSVRQMIDTTGSVVKYYTYEPFGELLESQEQSLTLKNSFLFTGQFLDSEINEYYLRARQYDPQVMRFTGRDSVDGKFEEPMSLHKYLYCLNDPVDCVDPSGELLDTVIAVSEEAGMYAGDLAVGGLALYFTYAVIVQNEIYQAAIESIVIGVTYEVDQFVDFGFDVLAATRTKAARKDIAGNIEQFNIHLNKVRNSTSPTDPLEKWLKEMKTFVNNVRKATNRLKGKTQDEMLRQVDDMWKTLEELAKERNLPWG